VVLNRPGRARTVRRQRRPRLPARDLGVEHRRALGHVTPDLGFGRIVALYHRPSTLYQIHEQIRCLYF
jgi:hypothetical protein